MLVWTCYDCAGVLLERNDAGDTEKAKKLLSEGLSITGKLGMKLLEGRITERMALLDAPSSEK